jgi:predicted nucleic acid-binding Zn ribbon protein
MAFREPKPIGEVIAELVARRGLSRSHDAEAWADAWSEAVGPMAARYCQVGRLRRGKLEIIVANSLLVQELTFRKKELLRKMKDRFPELVLKELFFKVGAVADDRS